MLKYTGSWRDGGRWRELHHAYAGPELARLDHVTQDAEPPRAQGASRPVAHLLAVVLRGTTRFPTRPPAGRPPTEAG
eukprot:5523519-Alexandrium_andersonii.AAC.1